MKSATDEREAESKSEIGTDDLRCFKASETEQSDGAQGTGAR
jgi:hypothetical protein